MYYICSNFTGQKYGELQVIIILGKSFLDYENIYLTFASSKNPHILYVDLGELKITR